MRCQDKLETLHGPSEVAVQPTQGGRGHDEALLEGLEYSVTDDPRVFDDVGKLQQSAVLLVEVLRHAESAAVRLCIVELPGVHHIERSVDRQHEVGLHTVLVPKAVCDGFANALTEELCGEVDSLAVLSGCL